MRDGSLQESAGGLWGRSERQQEKGVYGKEGKTGDKKSAEDKREGEMEMAGGEEKRVKERKT